MPVLHTLARRTSVALLTVGLLGIPAALGALVDTSDTLGTQLTAMSGTGLMLAECRERMNTLGSVLGKAGYGSMRSYLNDSTTMIARWYHPERHTTVVAFAGWQASDNAFSVAEFPGALRWNDLMVMP